MGYGDTAILADLNLSVPGGQKIAVTGANGSGKSTLIRTITGALEPLAGRIVTSSAAQIGYLSQEQDVLQPEQTALETVQNVCKMNQTEARSFLHYFLFSGDDPLRQVATLSYGERARLMLARLVAGGANVLVMDEPLNHLDLISREQFEQAIMNFNGTVLMVMHDRAFMERFADAIWQVADGEVTVGHRAAFR